MQQLANNLEDTTGKRSYTTLWVMIILFALPYIAATYFYLNQEKISLPGSNYGELISPVRQLATIKLDTLNNKKFSFPDVKGKWVLLTVGNSSCGQACQENMYKIRQIRKAVGQERGRVERVFLLTDKKEMSQFNRKLADYTGMLVALATNEDHTALLETLVMENANSASVKDGIYIIDPLGNFMMAYKSGADAEGILKDVRRLLKVSKIG